MKKLLLALLLTSASIHAMDNVRIVPFDSNTQGQVARDIWCKTLPGFIVPSYLWHSPDPTKRNANVDILMLYANAANARDNHDGTPIGLILHSIEASEYGRRYWNTLHSEQFKAYSTKEKESAAFIRSFEDKKFTCKYLTGVCIDTPYQNQGYGRLLVQHAEDHAEKERCDMISVYALESEKGFYKKLGYLRNNLDAQCSLAKPLSLHASCIINAIAAIIAKQPEIKDTDNGNRPAKKLKETIKEDVSCSGEKD